MGLLQRVSCALGTHRRDRRRVWHDGDDYRSYCAGCEAPMLRTHHGWETIKAHPPKKG